jgi:predicted TIM-barrel fold metal-dependent hydrolase
MEIVDAHPHVIASDRARYPFSPLAGTVPDWVLGGLPREGYAAALDDAGIGRAVLVQGSMGYGFDNNYVADSAAAQPDRFAGVGAIDLGAADTPERMTYWARERGLAGFRIFLTAPGMGSAAFELLDEPRTFGVWETARTLGVPMKLQIRPAAFPRVAQLAQRYPDVDLIIDHCGGIALDDGPPFTKASSFFGLARYPRVNVLFSDHVIRSASQGTATPRAFFERALATFGADRMLWGSNFPSSKGTVKELLALAQDTLAFVSEPERAAMFAGTARRLYKLT